MAMLCGVLSPWHGASSCYRWRRWSPDIKGSCKYIEAVVVDS